VTGLLLLAVGLGTVTVAVTVWQLLLAVLVVGAGIPIGFVAFNTLLQRVTPARLMGRVSTSVEVLTTTPQAVSIATGAVLVGLLDYRVIFAVIGAGTLLAACYPLVVLRGLLRPPRTTEEPAAEPQPGPPVIPGSVLPEPLTPVPPSPGPPGP
jgi:MFS family permease